MRPCHPPFPLQRGMSLPSVLRRATLGGALGELRLLVDEVGGAVGGGGPREGHAGQGWVTVAGRAGLASTAPLHAEAFRDDNWPAAGGDRGVAPLHTIPDLWRPQPWENSEIGGKECIVREEMGSGAAGTSRPPKSTLAPAELVGRSLPTSKISRPQKPKDGLLRLFNHPLMGSVDSPITTFPRSNWMRTPFLLKKNLIIQ